MRQIKLAEKLRLSQSHLSEIEAGRKQPTIDLLQKYAEVFDMPLSSILYFAERRDRKGKSAVGEAIAKKALQMLSWIDVITDDKKKLSHS